MLRGSCVNVLGRYLTICCIVVKIGGQVVHSWERLQNSLGEIDLYGLTRPNHVGEWMPDLRFVNTVEEVSRRTIAAQDDVKVLQIQVGWEVSDRRWVEFIAAVSRSTKLNHVETLRFVGSISKDKDDPTRRYLTQLCAAQMVPWFQLCPNITKVVLVRCTMAADAGGQFTRASHASQELMEIVLAKPLIKVAWSEILVAVEVQEYWYTFLLSCHEVKPCMTPLSFETAANQDMCVRLMGRFGLEGIRCRHFNLISCSTTTRPRRELIGLLNGGVGDWSKHMWTVGVEKCAEMYDFLHEVVRLGDRVRLGGLIIAHSNRDLAINWEGEAGFVVDDPALPGETVGQRRL